MDKLADAEILERCTRIEDWVVQGDGINKVFVFPDFTVAFAWMGRVAAYAEEIDHHPNWKNIYDRVAVTLYTHRAGGLTDLDFCMAERMDQYFGEQKR